MEPAEAEEREFERSYHEFKAIPDKVEQLTSKVASLEAERLRLTQTNWDAKIKYLLEAELNPKPGVIIHESILSLLVQRDTLKIRLEVIDSLLVQCKAALGDLVAGNERLSKELDLPPHKLS